MTVVPAERAIAELESELTRVLELANEAGEVEVVGGSIDTAINGITVEITPEASLTEFDPLLAALDVPVTVVQGRVVSPAHGGSNHKYDPRKYRGGLRYTSASAGTTGFLVRFDNSTGVRATTVGHRMDHQWVNGATSWKIHELVGHQRTYWYGGNLDFGTMKVPSGLHYPSVYTKYTGGWSFNRKVTGVSGRYDGMPVCASLGKSKRVRCGQVTDAIYTYTNEDGVTMTSAMMSPPLRSRRRSTASRSTTSASLARPVVPSGADLCAALNPRRSCYRVGARQ